MRRRARAALACCGLIALVGCESVPDIHFVDDGLTDADQLDGFAGDGGDGGLGDGSTDAASVCPASPPAGYQGCCGDTPCKGTCNQLACGNCGGCAPGEYCCAVKPNAAACKPTNAACQ